MKNLSKWKNHTFTSGGETGQDYIDFQKDFLGHFKRALKKNNIEFVNPVKGHYYCSCIVKNTLTNKFAYFSISDVRFFKNEWCEHILYRTCEHERDWTGGPNCYCTFEDLVENVVKITN